VEGWKEIRKEIKSGRMEGNKKEAKELLNK
jgi:hypothetical protein